MWLTMQFAESYDHCRLFCLSPLISPVVVVVVVGISPSGNACISVMSSSPGNCVHRTDSQR